MLLLLDLLVCVVDCGFGFFGFFVRRFFESFLLLLQEFVYMALLVVRFDVAVLCVFFLRFFPCFFLRGHNLVDILLFVLIVELALLLHFLFDKRFDWRLFVVVLVHDFCRVASDDFFNERIEFLKRRRIGCEIAFYLQIDFCVQVLLHSLESLETSLILFTRENYEHEIRHADERKRGEMNDAHFCGGQNAVAPKREQREQHERYADKHARANVLVLLDEFVVHRPVADYVAGIAETNAEILHPSVTQRLRRVFGKTMRSKIAHVVIVHGVHVCEVLSDFSCGNVKFASARAEKGKRNDDSQTENHRHNDDEKQIRIDRGKFLRHFRKPLERLFKKVHESSAPPRTQRGAPVSFKYLYDYT